MVAGRRSCRFSGWDMGDERAVFLVKAGAGDGLDVLLLWFELSGLGVGCGLVVLDERLNHQKTCSHK